MRLFLIRVAMGAAIILFALGFFKAGWREGYTDFEVYYRASERLQGGDWGSLYTPRDGRSMFRYSPLTFPFILPWAWLDFRVSLVAWFLVMYACFAVGFVFLHRVLRKLTPDPTLIAALAFLLNWRFIFDSFRIGQVTGMMFLGLCLGIWGIMMNRPWATAGGIMIPTALKIGLGILYPQAMLARDKIFGARVLMAAAVIFAGLWLGIFAVCGGIAPFFEMLMGWKTVLLTVVESGSQDYLDSAHYGSQSLNSAILRFVQKGMISPATGHALWAGSVTLMTALYLAILVFRRPKNMGAQFSAYGLGVMIYFLAMPFTFKYALAMMVVPVAALLLDFRSRINRIALVAGALTLFLPGKDVIGSTLFFAMNRASIPTLGMLVITAALLMQTWRRA